MTSRRIALACAGAAVVAVFAMFSARSGWILISAVLTLAVFSGILRIILRDAPTEEMPA